jgi:hypothetical protein
MVTMKAIGMRICDIVGSPKIAGAALGGVAVTLFAYGALLLALRVLLPAQLEIFEGKMVCAAYEVSLGHPMYRDPAHFAPADIYTPLYTVLLGNLYRVVDPSFLWGRLISTASTLLTMAMLGLAFWKSERRSVLLLSVLLGMLMSAAWLTQWFYSACKPDALCHALWVAGILVLLWERSPALPVSALLLAAAFFTKQTALIAIPGAFLFVAFRSRKRAVLYVGLLAVAFISCHALFKHLAGDWMDFYVFGRVARKVGRGFPVTALMREFFAVRGAPLAVLGAALALINARRHWRRPLFRLFALSAPFLVVGSVLTSASPDSGANSMLPAYYALSTLGAIGVGILLRSEMPRVQALWLAASLLLLHWDAQMPYHVSKALGRFDQDFIQLVDFLRDRPGAMYCPSHNVITLLAGRSAPDDRVLAGYIADRDRSALDRIVRRMNSGEFRWLICGQFEGDEALIREDVRKRYREATRFGGWTVLERIGDGPWVP